MTPSDVDTLLEAAIPSFGRTTLTLAEAPEDAGELLRLFERALLVGNRRGAPLAEIQAPLSVFPDLAPAFWHVPIEDSSRDGVVRLSFERPDLSSAA
ncbi:MAG: hypothetical protein H6870_15850 [Methylobacteriaceae bacterium]|nr:hypothetical protein [Methylobacteriaceae bacterium]